MKKGFLFCIVLTQVGCLFGCSNKINNAEYNDYFNKVSQIVNDFIPSNNSFKKQTNNSFKKQILKRKIDKDDDIFSIIDKAEGKEQRPDFANAFEQSFYIPVIVGKGLTEYRKQTNFYDVTVFADEQYYIKTYLEGEVISTNIYIPSELSIDGVSQYLYFSVDYRSEDNYKFSGVQISEDSSIEWYFYGDNTLLFLEYTKTPERTVINYQNSNLESKEIFDQNVVLDVRNRLNNEFSLINKNNFKNLTNESKFDISKIEYSNILDDLFDTRGSITLEGLQVYDGVAKGYIAQSNETTIRLPNSITAIANDFYISSPNGNIKELFIPKSVKRIVDQSGNDADISSFEIIYRNDNDDFCFLEKIVVEEGSPLFKTDGICLTNTTEDTLLYIMNENISDLDLSKYYIYSNSILYAPLPDCITKLKTFKYNIVRLRDDNYPFDILLNQCANEDLEFDTINYDYLEVCNIENEYSFSVYNRNVHINKLVLNGTFEKVYVDDGNGAINNVEIKSTNPNACVLGVLNGIDVFDVYNNNLNDDTQLFGENIKKIIVHEGVSEFSLDRFGIDYYKEGYFELYLPSTLKKFECDRLSMGGKTLKVKIISKTNDVMFTNFSRLKASGCEIKIEDNEELDNIFLNYEYVTYAYNKKGELTNNAIRLTNYLGNEEELYVPNKINSLPVTEFCISSRSSINYEPMTNTKTLKRLHLPNSLTCFSYEQSYFINGNDYSDERNYHLDSVYYDGTYDEFRLFFDSSHYLIEHKFCKEIVFLDQVIKDNTPEIHDEVFYNDLNIMIEEKGEDGTIIKHNVAIMSPSIRFENEGYSLYFLINDEPQIILLQKRDKFYNGVFNHKIIGKMEFLFYYNDASLKIRYTYNFVEKEVIFEKIK